MYQTFDNYSDTLQAVQHPDISIQHDSTSAIAAVTLLLLGTVSFSTSFLAEPRSIPLCMMLFLLGLLLVGGGLYCLFGRCKKKVYTPTGSKLKEKTLFFEEASKSRLLSFLEAGICPHKELPHPIPNGKIRLDVLHSADGKFAAAQLMEFEPYSFYPASPIYYYEGEQAGEIRDFLEKTRK